MNEYGELNNKGVGVFGILKGQDQVLLNCSIPEPLLLPNMI